MRSLSPPDIASLFASPRANPPWVGLPNRQSRDSAEPRPDQASRLALDLDRDCFTEAERTAPLPEGDQLVRDVAQ